MKLVMLLVLILSGNIAFCIRFNEAFIYPKLGDSTKGFIKISRQPYRLIHRHASSIIVADYKYFGITYTIGDYSDKVFFILTRDQKFKTPEGVSVNSSMRMMQKVDTAISIRRDPDGYYFIKLRSGWTAYTDNYDSSLHVKWIVLQ